MKDLFTLKRMIFQLYCILDKKQKISMLGVFFAILVGSAFELLGVTAMLPFITAILSPDDLLKKSYIRSACELFHIRDSQGVIVMVGIGIVLIYLVKNAYLAFSSYLQAAYTNRTKKELSVLMLRSYLSRPYSYFVNCGSKAILQGVHEDTRAVCDAIMNGFRLLTELLVVIAVTLYLVSMDWVIALGIVIICFFCMLTIIFGLKKRISGMAAISRKFGEREFSCLLQTAGGIKDIMVHLRHDFFLKKYDEAVTTSCKAATGFEFIGTLPERFIEAFCVSGIIISVLVRLNMGVDVNDFVPKMAVFAVGAFRLLPSISRLTGNINNMVYHRQYVEATYDNFALARAYQKEQAKLVNDSLEKEQLGDSQGAFKNEITIQNIHWRYPEGIKNVLNGVTLTVHKGEAIGIIGESGSGKSTLADILLRLYHPQNGEILMDGIKIDSIPAVWAKVVGYVPQTVFLVDDTIRENVVFGADNSEDEKVWAALEKASLNGYIKNLPDGLETIVGERGIKLSGGQRQRIAIARALYENPQIMILDEATSALDTETEEAVMEAIDSLAGTMTLIIIAHRLTTLKGCDRVFEIIEGKAIERDIREVV